MSKLPKFKIDDKVSLKRKTLYDETEGVITNVEKIFQKLDKFTGKIDTKGLVTRESDISSIKIPYKFNGEILEVTYPESNFGGFIQKERTEKSIFAGYCYTVKTPKMNTIYSEKSLTLLK